MENMQIAYKGEFTVEQRKIMTAQALQELRKAQKLSQKEVAAYLNIPATTYNTYESGRTEPPIEILVRLSHLYSMPIDLIVQRDRTYGTADDVGRQMAELKAEMHKIDQRIAENGPSDPDFQKILSIMEQFTDAMTAYVQTDAVRKSIEKPMQDSK